MFQSIFKSAPFLSNYDEAKSFFFLNRSQLLDISRNVYKNKLFITSQINVDYQAFLHRKLQERIQMNTIFLAAKADNNEQELPEAEEAEPKV